MAEFDSFGMGTRRFGAVNWLGLRTLVWREVMRFMSIWMQTIMAPLVTAGLLLMIFSIAIGERRGMVMGVDFTTFIAPGIVMMTVIQNAFANTSSSLMSAKVQGNIVDTLMPPLSAGEVAIGYFAGGILRGLLIAVITFCALWLFLGIVPTYPLLAVLFACLGATLLSGLGMIAAIYANKFDQMAAISNFIITPLAFLSGTFYSVQDLPPVLAWIAHINPIFYLIDGMRFATLGLSDSAPGFGLVVCAATCAVILFVTWRMLKSGYRLKH